MSDPVPTIAAVGLGHWGKNIVRNLDAIGALHTIFDNQVETRAAIAQLYPNARVAESYDALLADKDIDAVMIATPAVTHGALADAALDAGKHVFVEKPICLNLEEAERLNAKAAANDLTLMVGHLLHYHPAFQALLSLIQTGRLGRLRYVYSNRASLGRIRREENALWSFAPHDISMILAIVGRMPENVVANGGTYLSSGVADTTLSHIEFSEGVQAHIFVSWLHPYKDQRLVVIGEDAMCVFNDVVPGEDKLVLYSHKAGWDGAVSYVAKAEPEPIPYGDGEPLEAECRAFIGAVTGRAVPPSDAAEGIRVLRVLDACQRSLSSGAPVPLT